MSVSWKDLEDDFRRVVFDRGVQCVADAIPADRATVYRLIGGKTSRPTRAVVAGVARVVSEGRPTP